MQLASCSKESHPAPGTTSAGTDSARIIDSPITSLDPGVSATLGDVAYGRDVKQKLDLNLIAGRDVSTPFVILLHGGAWSQGDKNDLASLVRFFLSQKINVANVNYRLTNTSSGSVRWTGILSDVNAAVSYITKHADSLKTRSRKYVIFGFSAGAHLALLHTYSYDSSNLISAVIGFGSPTKLNDIAWKANPYLGIAKQALPPLTGQSFTTDTSNTILKDLSPYFSSHFKATLLIHGDQDNVVPYSQSVLMHNELRMDGVASTFISLPHSGHSGEGASPTDLNDTWQTCAAWIKTYSR